MSRDFYVTAHGAKVVPRFPFRLAFRPPDILIQHEDKAVIFEPADSERLDSRPIKDATVEDVATEVSYYPPIPVISFHTEHFHFAILRKIEIYASEPSTPELPFAFNLHLEERDDDGEVVLVTGPHSQIDWTDFLNGATAIRDGRIEKVGGTAEWREREFLENGERWRHRRYAVTLFSTRSLDARHFFNVEAYCKVGRDGDLFPCADEIVETMSNHR